jgi:hypothetical protein
VQKLLGKINYLRRFISNLAGRVGPFLPLVKLKHDESFTWGAKHQQALENIMEYLVSPPVLRASRIGEAFRLYVATQQEVVGVALTQESGGKEHVVAYLN